MAINWKALALAVTAFVAGVDDILQHLNKLTENEHNLSKQFREERESERIRSLCETIETVGRSKADLIDDVDGYLRHPTNDGLTRIRKSLEDVHHGLNWLAGVIRETDISNRDLSLRVAIQGEHSANIILNAVNNFPALLPNRHMKDLRRIGSTIRTLQQSGVQAMSSIQAHLDQL